MVQPHPRRGLPPGARNTGNGFIGKNTVFMGRQSHAGAAPWDGINALNMASLAMSAMAYQRETLRRRTRSGSTRLSTRRRHRQRGSGGRASGDHGAAGNLKSPEGDQREDQPLHRGRGDRPGRRSPGD